MRNYEQYVDAIARKGILLGGAAIAGNYFGGLAVYAGLVSEYPARTIGSWIVVLLTGLVLRKELFKK